MLRFLPQSCWHVFPSLTHHHNTFLFALDLLRCSGDYNRNKMSVGDLLVHEVCHIEYQVPEGLKSREMQQA